jgi:hypothetical protein
LTMCHWSDHDPSSALGGVRCRHDTTARVLYSDPMHAPGIPLYYYSIIICITAMLCLSYHHSWADEASTVTDLYYFTLTQCMRRVYHYTTTILLSVLLLCSVSACSFRWIIVTESKRCQNVCSTNFL